MAVMATNAAEAMIEPVIPRYLKVNYDMDPGQAGLVFSAVPFAYLLATPIAGCLGDKGKKWKLVFAGMVFMSLGLPIMWAVKFVMQRRGGCRRLCYIDRVCTFIREARSEDFAQAVSTPAGLAIIIVSLAFAGAGLAFVDAPSMPLVTEIMDWRGHSAYGSAIATVNMSVNLGFIVGPLGGSALAQYYGTSAAMACFAVLAAATAPLVALLAAVGRQRKVNMSQRSTASQVSLVMSPTPATQSV